MLLKLLGRALYTIGLCLWVFVAFMLGQILSGLLFSVIRIPVNPAVETTLLAALGYGLALAIAIGVPALITKKPIVKSTLGISRLPSWSDIGLSFLAILPYFLLSGLFLWVGTEVLHLIDQNVGQELPFQNLHLRLEYIVAFITLVILAPVAEEILFRGYFLGRLKERTGKIIAVVVTAVLFGLFHLPAFTDSGLVLQWGVTFDTMAFGVIAGTLRLLSGSVWAGILFHAMKNGIAYYFLFIAPLSGGGQ